MKTKIIFTLCCIFLIACGKDCPEFPKHLIDYYPYKSGEVFSFVNQNNDTLTLWVKKSWSSKQTSISPCGKCACEYPISYFSAHRLISKSFAEELGIVGYNEIDGLVDSGEVLQGIIEVSDHELKTNIMFIAFPYIKYCIHIL